MSAKPIVCRCGREVRWRDGSADRPGRWAPVDDPDEPGVGCDYLGTYGPGCGHDVSQEPNRFWPTPDVVRQQVRELNEELRDWDAR